MTNEEKKQKANHTAREADDAGDPVPEVQQADQGSPDEDLRAAQEEAAALRDQLLRKAAEFENYKRRTEAEFGRMMENASRHLIEDLLPVLDDFDRLLKSADDAATVESIREGCSLIAAKLNKVLASRGLSTFESVGKQFDVNLHDALLQVPGSAHPPNTVVEEVSKGYRLNDRIIRHAKVVVSADEQHAGTDAPAADDDTTRNEEAES